MDASAQYYPSKIGKPHRKSVFVTPDSVNSIALQKNTWDEVRQYCEQRLPASWNKVFAKAHQLQNKDRILSSIQATFPDSSLDLLADCYQRWTLWKTLKTESRRLLRQDKSAHFETILDEARKCSIFNDTKGVWKALHSVVKIRSKDEGGIKSSGGEVCHTTEQKQAAYINYLTQTLKCTTDLITLPPLIARKLTKYNSLSVQSAINSLPLDKAIPIWSTTTAEWRANSIEVSSSLAPRRG